MWKRQKILIFRIKYNFLTLFHWTRKSSLEIVQQGFRSNSKRSHLYENFQRVVFSKFLWTRKRQFWQPPRKLFLPKDTLSRRSKSGKNEWYLNFASENFSLTLFFCTHRIQLWKNCRKLLAKSLTKFLLKIRESKQKIDFSKESRQRRSSGHAGCGSQLHQMSFTRIEIKDRFKIRLSSKVFPSTRRKEMWQLYAVFFAQSQNLVKTWKLFHSIYFLLKMFHWRW